MISFRFTGKRFRNEVWNAGGMGANELSREPWVTPHCHTAVKRLSMREKLRGDHSRPQSPCHAQKRRALGSRMRSILKTLYQLYVAAGRRKEFFSAPWWL